MNIEDMNQLKEILSFPTKTGQEHEFVAYICNLIREMGYAPETDTMGNIFVTKGITDMYPLVVAHLDTVNSIKSVDVVEELRPNAQGEIKLALCAHESITGENAGLGADDKNGVYICLQLLKNVDNIKVYFAVQEETGCHGSYFAVENNAKFFINVAYAMMWDSPENDTTSYTLMGINLFDVHGEFFRIVKPILLAHGINKFQAHPYTDSMVLREQFGFANLNLAAGYYRYHSRYEYTVVEDVMRAIDLGLSLVTTLGVVQYT